MPHLAAAMHANAIAALHRGSRVGMHADRAHLGPWILIDADAGPTMSFLNVAIAASEIDQPDRAVPQAEAWFAARRASFCFLLRQDVDAAAIAHLCRIGYRIDHRLPALALEPLPDPEPPPPGLEVTRVIDREQLAIYSGIGGDEQGLDRRIMASIAQTSFEGDGFELLIGWLDDRAVATSLALAAAPVVGIYNVNVVEGARKRGIGTAMTWAAIEAGRRIGCRAAFLESTPRSHRLYERMGFRTRFSYVQLAR